ncbi:hypothetical protein P280DRAFT_546588 [Massarina eburnea CBS 473.64]|uniref:UBA domain-containing protein n=1 Tax=Massarina eburnea CBS 473.64 TaxID=1395130 RepID=A0A6A6SB71_9PLEO|nr:hypothetical protein P280DRAFT_546588 [Massarina eburnea CBS 473.64]
MAESWYMFLAEEREINLFWAIRAISSMKRPGIPASKEQLNQVIESYCALLGVQFYERDVLNADKIVAGLVRIGAEIPERILNERTGSSAAAEDDPEDHDYVLGCQTQINDAEQSKAKIISWKDVKADLIPACVKSITFTMEEDDLSPEHRLNLEERFPGVLLQASTNPPSTTAPAGIDMLPMDEEPERETERQSNPAATTHDQAVAELVDMGFPADRSAFALGTTKSGCDVKRAVGWLLNAEHEAESRSLPAKAEGSRRKPEGSRHPRSVAFVEKPLGLKNAFFKIDSVELKSNPDLLSAIRQQFPWASVESETATSRLGNDIVETGLRSLDLSSETAMSESSRDSRVPKNFPAAGFQPLDLTPEKEFTIAAEDFGLALAHPQSVCSMYAHWKNHGIIRRYSPKQILNEYYQNLVDIYIVSHKKGWKDVEYAIEVSFQITNCTERSALPPIWLIYKAFQHLPTNSALCKWIHILYAFLWNTQGHKDYDDFCIQELPMETPALTSSNALARILYGVAWHRCSFTQGNDYAVLERWCDVHSHKPGSDREKMCDDAKKTLVYSLKEAKQDEDKLQLDKAIETVEDSGGRVIMRSDNTASTGQSTTKRKSGAFYGDAPNKRGKGSRGRGVGR